MNSQHSSRSDKRRAERNDTDKQLREQANNLITHPATVVDMVEKLAATSVTPRMLRYSLRNQLLLMIQATDRGLKLSDVDTYQGWCERGRRVRRGERGLRIVAPASRPDSTNDNNDSTEPKPDNNTHQQPEQEESLPIRFRMVSVFDISQTDLDPTMEVTRTPHPTMDAPTVLATNLTEQIQRFGYTITTTATGTIMTIDNDRRTVEMPQQKTAENLAAALSILHGTAHQRDEANSNQTAHTINSGT